MSLKKLNSMLSEKIPEIRRIIAEEEFQRMSIDVDEIAPTVNALVNILPDAASSDDDVFIDKVADFLKFCAGLNDCDEANTILLAVLENMEHRIDDPGYREILNRIIKRMSLMRVRYIGKDTIAFEYGKAYDVISVEHGLYRIFTELDETYLFPSDQFNIVHEDSLKKG